MIIKRVGSRLLLAVGIVLLLFFSLFPFLQMLSTSLKTPDQLFTVPPNWIPKSLTFANFEAAINHKQFADYFLNSLFVSVVTCILAIVVSVLPLTPLPVWSFRDGNFSST